VKKYILGLSFDYHESAAALICDGQIVAASSEERFSRKKNDNSFPGKAIRFCLESAGITQFELEKVVFYENAPLKFERIVIGAIKNWNAGKDFFWNALNSWLDNGKFWPEYKISEKLGIPLSKITSVMHHQSHIAAAYFNSPFKETLIITLDGIGEYESGTVSIANHAGEIERIKNIHLPNSLGLFYSAITSYLGFKVNEDEYKVMGMAGFGIPEYAEILRKFFVLSEDGSFLLKSPCFDFYSATKVPYTAKFIEALGQPRKSESPFSVVVNDSMSSYEVSQCKRYANIAASAQLVTEEVISHILGTYLSKLTARNVCMAGGVALNSLANGRLRKTLGCNLYVHPAAGDAGSALGAAQYYWHMVLGNPKISTNPIPYYGKMYSSEYIKNALDELKIEYVECGNTQQLLSCVAGYLYEGKVIGWLQGRAEWGPRALGNRSILANPCLPNTQDIVNTKIKFREPFRPFAPAILEECVADYFEIDSPLLERDPMYYMLSVVDVKEDKKSLIPAVTHVDGTARVQIVKRDWNQLFYSLIEEFAKYSNVPIILNTSFNRRGEPIVNSPLDALVTFFYSGLDILVLDQFVVRK